jgi:hypothetical protein
VHDWDPEQTATHVPIVLTTAQAAARWGITWQAARLRLVSGWGVRVAGRPTRWRLVAAMMTAKKYQRLEVCNG